jgi:UDP-glucose:(heptosyl)LPS alpha-1,3-glucosyltransferase
VRIGLVIPNFDPRLGGAEQWTWQFARWLAAAGEEVHLFASRFADAAAALPIERHAIAPSSSRIGFAAAASEAVKRVSLDVVHDMGAGWHCDLFQPHGGSREASFRQNLLLAPRWLRPGKRLAAHWLPRYRQFNQLAARQYAGQGRLFLALSKMVARDFRQYHAVPAERIRLVYNGVDVERFSPGRRGDDRQPLREQLGLDDRQILLLIVAHNFQLKGVPTAIRAVRHLRRQGLDVHLAIAGGKPKNAGSSARLDNSHEPYIHYLGHIDDAAACYAAADIYVQPTWYDPCSLVVLEALASGLPVVTSRFNGAGELLTPGVDGFVMHNPASGGELAGFVAELIDPQTRRRYAAAARKLALQHTLERNCQQILAIYREIAGERRRAAA